MLGGIRQQHPPGSPESKTQSSLNTTTNKKNGKRRALDWRPRTAEEIARKKNRKVINQHLKRIGKAAGRDLSLDQNGVCVFSFKKFVVSVEVPHDNSSICLMHSMVCQLRPEDNLSEVRKFMDLYNHRQASNSSSTAMTASTSTASSNSSQELPDASSGSETSTVDTTCPCAYPRSTALGRTQMGMNKDEKEVNLCVSFPIQGLSFQDTAGKLEFFVKTAVAANRKLTKVKAIPPRKQPLPALLEEEAPPSPSNSVGRRLRLWSVDSQNSVSNMSQRSIFGLFSSQPSLDHSS